ncbi:MAG: A/G-specific adenine glycosylase [Gallionellaceae bacterium]|nr:A/G-specific adenine glycosylase [Gallionellaceae bacterium]
MKNDFAFQLIAWQHSYGRHGLPWQGGDAYRVWLSEIMLQQTQVATVIPYYQKFIASFPNVIALAAATEDQVLVHWSGLGYYARGRNLHKAARIIAEKYAGEFPREFEQIIELPGIGRSTAAAICALAFHEHRAILDGNVKRVLARYCGIEGWVGDKRVEAQLWQQAESLLPKEEFPRPAEERARERGGVDSSIATYTQALMDMGATVCTRSKPKCALCPVQSDCVALKTDRIAQLPTARPKKTVPERNAIFLLLMHGSDILLEKRPGSGIWGGLWCPPQFEDEMAAKSWFVQNGLSASEGERLETFTHIFTHFKLHITPLKISLVVKLSCAAQSGSVWLDVSEALQAAIPTPVRTVLQKLSHSRRMG